jgi:CHAD domain-containing protein
MRESRERIATWRLDAEEFGAVAGGLRTTYERARDAMDRVRAAPSDTALHEWRKRTKYHAHHLRLLRPIWDEPLRARANVTKALSDLLGRDHDLAVLVDALQAAAPVEAAEKSKLLILQSLAREHRLELRDEAELLGARVFAEKSKHFAGRFEAYWGAWRRETARRPSAVSGSGRSRACG